MVLRNLTICFLVLSASSMFCCGLLTAGGPADAVELFTKAGMIEDSLEKVLADTGIQVVDVEMRDERLAIEIEQPDNLTDEQVELLYLTVFDAASRRAPFANPVSLLIRIDGEPFLQLDAEMDDVRAFRRGKISEGEFYRRLTIRSP